jgi:hypothetical protein
VDYAKCVRIAFGTGESIMKTSYDNMLDIRLEKGDVLQIERGPRGTVVWMHVNDKTVVRIQGIDPGVSVLSPDWNGDISFDDPIFQKKMMPVQVSYCSVKYCNVEHKDIFLHQLGELMAKELEETAMPILLTGIRKVD